LSNVVEGKAGIGLVLKNSPGNYTNAVYPIYTPGLINPSNKDYRLAWLAQNSGEYELKQTTDGGNTWTSLSGGNSSTNLLYWNYAGNKGESSAMASLVFGELNSPYVFIDNPIAIQGGDNSRLGIRPVNVSGQLNWEACDSYGNWAPISSSTVADDYLTVHGESLEAKYVGATSGKAYSGDNIKTYRLSPKNDTAVIYALQTFLAASGLHGNVDYLSSEAARTVMTLVEGATQASTPSILWTTNDGKGFRKWEPWKEDGSSSASGSTDSKLQIKSGENSDKKTFIVETSPTFSSTVMSLQLYSSKSKTSQLYALAAPWFASSNSTNYGMRIVPDSDLSSMIELTTNGGSSWNKLPWPATSEGSSGSSAGVYELAILDSGYDSGSQMLPLVNAQRLTDGTNVSLVNWSIGASRSNAQDASGMFTLVGNPIALYDSAYRNSGSSRIKGVVRVVDMHGTICWQRYNYTNKQWEIEPTGSSDSDSSSVPIVNALATADYGTPVSYLAIENVGNAYSTYGSNEYADDATFKRKSWEPTRLQTIEIGGNDGYNEFSGIVALRNYLAVPIKNPVGDKIQQQAPANTEHIIMGVHGMGVLKFSSGMDYNSYQTFKIDLSPFMPSLHGSTEPITSKMRWLLDNTEALAALLSK
jgi:hypothetical protein